MQVIFQEKIIFSIVKRNAFLSFIIVVFVIEFIYTQHFSSHIKKLE